MYLLLYNNIDEMQANFLATSSEEKTKPQTTGLIFLPVKISREVGSWRKNEY